MGWIFAVDVGKLWTCRLECPHTYMVFQSMGFAGGGRKRGPNSPDMGASSVCIPDGEFDFPGHFEGILVIIQR